MGRGNVARVSMRGRWIVHDDIMIMIMMMTMKMKKPLRSRVWPLMTIRKRRWGVRLSEENSERPKKKLEVGKSFGRICHRFGRIWIGRVPASGTFLRITVFILREKSAYGLGPFFGMLTDGVKIFETSPQYSAEGGELCFIHQQIKSSASTG